MSAMDFLLTINVPPGLEENLVDCLLTFDKAPNFTSFPVSAHDHRHTALSAVDQVMGRQRKIRFQMYVEKHVLPALITRLKADFSGSGLDYWVIPIVEQGKI
jgi:hypothetical protein